MILRFMNFSISWTILDLLLSTQQFWLIRPASLLLSLIHYQQPKDHPPRLLSKSIHEWWRLSPPRPVWRLKFRVRLSDAILSLLVVLKVKPKSLPFVSSSTESESFGGFIFPVVELFGVEGGLVKIHQFTDGLPSVFNAFNRRKCWFYHYQCWPCTDT